MAERFMEAMKDPEKAKKLYKDVTTSSSFRVWGGFAAGAIVVFWFFSSGDFSFLLTLSSLVSMFSFLMVASHISMHSSVAGVSKNMMECYILVFLCRLTAIIPFEGYLPFDKSGDWFYQLCEAVGLCLSGSIVYFCRVPYASTYNADADYMNHLYIIGPAAAISLVLHPHLNNFLPTDIAWAFALYLESVTVLPQFFMFMKLGKPEPYTVHFLAAQALSRLMSFIFWASSFSELSNPDHLIKKFVGNWVVLIQLVQLVLMGDFIYRYIRCIQKGVDVSEMMSESAMV